jgi:hypothetical protein
MSLKNLKMGDEIERPSTDTLGGSFNPDSGLYPMIIDVAYQSKSKGGAQAINIHLKSADPAKQVSLRQTLWVTSGDEKGNLPYFMGGKNKDKKIPLPDYQTFEQICMICVPGTKPDELAEEEKTLKLWNSEMRAEVPTEVMTLPQLKDQTFLAGIRKCRENKRVPKEPGSKIYVPVNEERVFSELHRVFFPNGFSVEEKAADADAPEFAKTWKKKHTSDYVYDTYKEVTGAAGTPAAAAASAAAAAIDDDIFDD